MKVLLSHKAKRRFSLFHLHPPFVGLVFRKQATVRSTPASCQDHCGATRMNSAHAADLQAPPILQVALLLPWLIRIWSLHELKHYCSSCCPQWMLTNEQSLPIHEIHQDSFLHLLSQGALTQLSGHKLNGFQRIDLVKVRSMCYSENFWTLLGSFPSQNCLSLSKVTCLFQDLGGMADKWEGWWKSHTGFIILSRAPNRLGRKIKSDVLSWKRCSCSGLVSLLGE